MLDVVTAVSFLRTNVASSRLDSDETLSDTELRIIGQSVSHGCAPYFLQDQVAILTIFPLFVKFREVKLLTILRYNIKRLTANV